MSLYFMPGIKQELAIQCGYMMRAWPNFQNWRLGTEQKLSKVLHKNIYFTPEIVFVFGKLK